MVDVHRLNRKPMPAAIGHKQCLTLRRVLSHLPEANVRQFEFEQPRRHQFRIAQPSYHQAGIGLVEGDRDERRCVDDLSGPGVRYHDPLEPLPRPHSVS
jgi:hypothetical protein